MVNTTSTVQENICFQTLAHVMKLAVGIELISIQHTTGKLTSIYTDMIPSYYYARAMLYAKEIRMGHFSAQYMYESSRIKAI